MAFIGTDYSTGSPYVCHEPLCECTFIQGRGWEIDEADGEPVDVEVEDCPAVEMVTDLRYAELRAECQQRYGLAASESIRSHGREVVLDLIARTQSNGFVITPPQ